MSNVFTIIGNVRGDCISSGNGGIRSIFNALQIKLGIFCAISEYTYIKLSRLYFIVYLKNIINVHISSLVKFSINSCSDCINNCK